MLLLRRTLNRVAWLSVLSVVGVGRASMAQSGAPPTVEEPVEPTPEPAQPAVGTLPPTATFPVETERPSVTAPAKQPEATERTAPRPTPIPTKARVQDDTPFDTTSRTSETNSTASAQTAPELSEQTSPDESSSRVIRLGPVLGVGLPGFISIGGMLKLTSYLGFGANIGFIPSMHISYYGDATLSYQEYDAYGRVFPFGGGFFLGAGVGYATIKGSMKSTFDTATYQAEAALAGIAVPNPLTYQSEGTVKTMIVAPQIGYFYTTDIGFSIGLDVGAQVPLAPSQVSYKSHLTLPPGTPPQVVSGIQSQYVTPNDKKVRDTLDTIGRTPLPTFNIKIGWLF